MSESERIGRHVKIELNPERKPGIVPGRFARIFLDGQEVSKVQDIVVDLPMDGVARVTISFLPESLDVEGGDVTIVNKRIAFSSEGV